MTTGTLNYLCGIVGFSATLLACPGHIELQHMATRCSQFSAFFRPIRP